MCSFMKKENKKDELETKLGDPEAVGRNRMENRSLAEEPGNDTS